MRVQPVGSDALETFCRFRLPARGAAPLLQQQMYELSPAAALAGHGRWQLFLAEDGGDVVGRVAALVNDDLRDVDGVLLGQVGYFECQDDDALARDLVSAALAWLRARGARRALGPMNGGAHRAHRFLTRGFDGAPFLFEPRNPPHYPRLFERCGFVPVHRWFSYELDRGRARALLERFGRVLRGRPPPGHIDVIDPSLAAPTLARLHALLDGFWADHVGYASLSLAEFGEVFAGALAVMTPRNLGFYVEQGRDLGCAFMYPDWIDAAVALHGDATLWATWPRTPLPSRLIMHTLALLPEARHSSAGLALMAHGLGLMAEDGYDQLLVALVVEGLLSTQLGAPTREYTLYQASL
jgi:GNAT superfamily N-acetyltransferase